MSDRTSEVNGWVEEELVPIRDKVYDYMKNAILNGEYSAGDRLIERELADKLKISRTPIREALLRLESHGLVKTVPRRGVIVSEISMELVLEIFTILSSLETLAVKMAVTKLDESTKNHLKEIVEKIDRTLDHGDQADQIIQFHMEVSDALLSAAKSPKLAEILKGLYEYIQVFVNAGYKIPGRMKESMVEHRQILESVIAEESDMAEYLTKIHIEKSKKAYTDVFEKTVSSLK